MIKTPEETKKALRYHRGTSLTGCSKCHYKEFRVKCAGVLLKDTLEYIKYLEDTLARIGKSLCGKENASFDEIIDQIVQLKAASSALEIAASRHLPDMRKKASSDEYN